MSKAKTKPAVQEKDEGLAPYRFHGVDLTNRGSNEAAGDCPLCGKEGKWSVNRSTGLWRCFSCMEEGNHYEFLRQLHRLSDHATPADWMEALAFERGVGADALRAWGVVCSAITGEPLLPGYNADGALCNLYRYAVERRTGARLLYPTTGCNHQLHAALQPELGLVRPQVRTVYICEGPWDGAALWEVLGCAAQGTDGAIEYTASTKKVMRRHCEVLAVPGAGVWNDGWNRLLVGKEVVLLYDNDHPRKHRTNGTMIEGAGWLGMRRVAQSLLAQPPGGRPASLRVAYWGGPGGEYYDDELPTGFDVRDLLCADAMSDRALSLGRLLDAHVVSAPASWTPEPATVAEKLRNETLQPLACDHWEDLEAAWQEAMEWGDGLSRTFSAMLACVASTGMPEDQLWLKVMGPPSCGKSTLCEALSVARAWVVPRSNIRGFHSGYKTDKDGSEDHGLISLVNGKTLVTKDGDTLLSTINLSSILSQARDIYDGSSRAHYLNGIDRNEENIRMTWILCGTPSLRALDTSELGERFIDIRVMDGIDEPTERKIQVKKLESLLGVSMNGRHAPAPHPDARHAAGMHGQALARAMQLTGGYVAYLREHAARLIPAVQVPREAAHELIDLAQFVSFMRARPSPRQDEVVERELSARLTGQLAQLARASAAVLGRGTLDAEVMRRVRQAALDTAQGRTLQMAGLLRKAPHGLEDKTLMYFLDLKQDKVLQLLQFLRKIGAVRHQARAITTGLKARPRWFLTQRLAQLYDRVIGAPVTMDNEE